MIKKISLIKDFLKKNKLSFFLFTNSDLHLNESPNLDLKDIYNLVGFDCSRGYLLVFDDKIVFFTDSRYTLAAHKHFKSSVLIFNLQKNSISDYLNNLGSNFNGGIDSQLISVSEFNLISKKLEKNNIKIIPFRNSPLNKNYYPDFNKSYSFSLPKSHIPRQFKKNLSWVRKSIKAEGLLIWNNAHIAYLLNIRSFELENSTKPFAGLFIFKNNKKPIIISNDNCLKEIIKIQNNFLIVSNDEFVGHLSKQKINSIELDYKYNNLFNYLSLEKICKIQNSKIDLDKFISKKTTVEFNNICLAHKEDGLSLTKFILKIKQNMKLYSDEYSFIDELYNLRKEGINFFRNSFDYISALDENGAIVHYKPTLKSSKKFNKQNILLLDSGAHYLEGTTDVTRVIKLNNSKNVQIKKYYTYLLKSLIKLENTIFNPNSTGSDLDNFIRKYLLKFGISYGHGTGHGVGYFNDVHEKYPIISPSFNKKLFHNNLFSIEPGYYKPDSYGLRIENLYFSKIHKGKLKLHNVTLVPYELDLIDWPLITQQEKSHIKKYHYSIFNNFKTRLNEAEKKDFLKLLINKL
jgi:Xaa-Pro aminopeptidase